MRELRERQEYHRVLDRKNGLGNLFSTLLTLLRDIRGQHHQRAFRRVARRLIASFVPEITREGYCFGHSNGF